MYITVIILAPFAFCLQFVSKTRVYILLPALTREPVWLRQLFGKLRHPATNKLLAIKSLFTPSWGFQFWLFLGMRYLDYRNQRIIVWESHKVRSVG